MRQLSLAFPENGVVTAKVIDIRDDGTVNCSGTMQDNTALLEMEAKLSQAPGVSDLKVEQIRGKSPMQFVFSFKYNENGGGNENQKPPGFSGDADHRGGGIVRAR